MGRLRRAVLYVEIIAMRAMGKMLNLKRGAMRREIVTFVANSV